MRRERPTQASVFEDVKAMFLQQLRPFALDKTVAQFMSGRMKGEAIQR